MHRSDLRHDDHPHPFAGLRHKFPGGPRGPLERGGPFGRGHAGRGGPRARRGDVRSAVLGLLAEAPSNGYGLIRAIAERTDGAWRPSPGSIYPTLAQLVDEGLITQGDDARGPYALTEAGSEHVASHEGEIRGAFDNASAGGGPKDLMSAVRKLTLAAAPFAYDVTEDQLAAAVAAVDGARRELHRILAE